MCTATQVSQLQTLDSDGDEVARKRRRVHGTPPYPSLFCGGWAPLPPADKVYPPNAVTMVAALQYFLQWRAQLVHAPPVHPTLRVVQLSLGSV